MGGGFFEGLIGCLGWRPTLWGWLSSGWERWELGVIKQHKTTEQNNLHLHKHTCTQTHTTSTCTGNSHTPWISCSRSCREAHVTSPFVSLVKRASPPKTAWSSSPPAPSLPQPMGRQVDPTLPPLLAFLSTTSFHLWDGKLLSWLEKCCSLSPSLQP